MSQQTKAMVERRTRLGVEEAKDLRRGEVMPFDNELDDKAGGDTNLAGRSKKGMIEMKGRYDFFACCVCMALGFI
ncbi:fidgetin-like protein 1 [Pyrus ussuriensis x Pyrus communis]|uniref:Fidgetin-like protein 1 n=1 Tax=Pyrus ussuriensis x Pyrus communis TaxID=2448454 RepID=A0A5N5FE91_9ROSA|nr:fidgetin-like protein 1 [Pyrus ussuriensis x Pyrus communis]